MRVGAGPAGRGRAPSADGRGGDRPGARRGVAAAAGPSPRQRAHHRRRAAARRRPRRPGRAPRRHRARAEGARDEPDDARRLPRGVRTGRHRDGAGRPGQRPAPHGQRPAVRDPRPHPRGAARPRVERPDPGRGHRRHPRVPGANLDGRGEDPDAGAALPPPQRRARVGAPARDVPGRARATPAPGDVRRHHRAAGGAGGAAGQRGAPGDDVRARADRHRRGRRHRPPDDPGQPAAVRDHRLHRRRAVRDLGGRRADPPRRSRRARGGDAAAARGRAAQPPRRASLLAQGWPHGLGQRDPVPEPGRRRPAHPDAGDHRRHHRAPRPRGAAAGLHQRALRRGQRDRHHRSAGHDHGLQPGDPRPHRLHARRADRPPPAAVPVGAAVRRLLPDAVGDRAGGPGVARRAGEPPEGWRAVHGGHDHHAGPRRRRPGHPPGGDQARRDPARRGGACAARQRRALPHAGRQPRGRRLHARRRLAADLRQPRGRELRLHARRAARAAGARTPVPHRSRGGAGPDR